MRAPLFGCTQPFRVHKNRTTTTPVATPPHPAKRYRPQGKQGSYTDEPATESAKKDKKQPKLTPSLNASYCGETAALYLTLHYLASPVRHVQYSNSHKRRSQLPFPYPIVSPSPLPCPIWPAQVPCRTARDPPGRLLASSGRMKSSHVVPLALATRLFRCMEKFPVCRVLSRGDRCLFCLDSLYFGIFGGCSIRVWISACSERERQMEKKEKNQSV